MWIKSGDVTGDIKGDIMVVSMIVNHFFTMILAKVYNLHFQHFEHFIGLRQVSWILFN